MRNNVKEKNMRNSMKKIRKADGEKGKDQKNMRNSMTKYVQGTQHGKGQHDRIVQKPEEYV